LNNPILSAPFTIPPIAGPTPQVTFRPNSNVNTFLSGPDSFQVQVRDLDFNPTLYNIPVNIIAVNTAPQISAPATLSATFTEPPIPAQTSDISFADDAADNFGIVSVSVASFGASSIELIDPSGISGYVSGQTDLLLTGTIQALNLAFGRGFRFVPNDQTEQGTITITINDNGHHDMTGNVNPLEDQFEIIVNISQELNLLGAAGFIGLTGLMSAGVFGAYRFMKKKKLLPEEADPWENDELFDMTLDNPLYSGTSSVSLDAVFDK